MKAMKVIPPSPKTVAMNDLLSSMPPTRLSAETVRAQVLQHLAEARAEMMKPSAYHTKRLIEAVIPRD
jgi:hypothetical protein